MITIPNSTKSNYNLVNKKSKNLFFFFLTNLVKSSLRQMVFDDWMVYEVVKCFGDEPPLLRIYKIDGDKTRLFVFRRNKVPKNNWYEFIRPLFIRESTALFCFFDWMNGEFDFYEDDHIFVYDNKFKLLYLFIFTFIIIC